MEISNKKAYFEYEILNKVEAGIQLTGTEIKAIREGKANLKESYCFFKKDELFIKGMHISEYSNGTHYNHNPVRLRKLLLTRRELDKFQAKVKERGFTIVPLRLFLSKRGWAKVEIGLARGKKTHDKRNSIKEKDLKRDLDRARSMSGY